MQLERPQLLGTDVRGIVERCRMCRGELAQAGEEVACTTCGAVARREERLHLEVQVRAPSQTANRRLGSYIGTNSDKNSDADFNGSCTVGRVKRLSDHMGEDQAVWHSAAMIERVAGRLSLPAFVRQSAVALSEKMLADRRKNEESGRRHRVTVPAISAYALLSACRAAGLDHVSAKSILTAYADLGHRVTKSNLLRLGTESQVPFRSANPAALLQTAINGLESNPAVAERMKRQGVEPRQYFRRLLQASGALVGELRGLREGTSPRTIAAGSVYLASRGIGPRIVTQKEVAEALQVAEYTVREFSCWARREFGSAASGPLNGGLH